MKRLMVGAKKFLLGAIVGGALTTVLWAYFMYVAVGGQVLVLTFALAVTLLILWRFISSVDKLQSQAEELRKRMASLDFDVSYKLVIDVVPNWEGIFEVAAGRNGATVEAVTAEVRGQQAAGKTRHLFQSYRFVTFHDGISGLEVVWRDADRTIVDRPEVRVRLVGLFSDSRLVIPDLIVSPGKVEFDILDAKVIAVQIS